MKPHDPSGHFCTDVNLGCHITIETVALYRYQQIAYKF